MPKPTDGVPNRAATRARARSRDTRVGRVNRRSIALARTLQDALHQHGGRAAAAVTAATSRALRPFASTDRALPVLVAAIVAVASLLAVLPTVSGSAVGRTSGNGQDVRIAANGGFDRYATAYEGRPDDVDGDVAGSYPSFELSLTLR